MNQILLTNNEKNNKNNSNNKGDIKKIIMFFGIVIIVFGIIIGGVYGYKTYKNINNKEKTISKPELSLEETEEINKVTIIAKSEIGINKIIYSWNEETEETIELNGRTIQEQKIDIPSGNNTLKVKVIDENGEEIEMSKDFSNQNNGKKPTITTSIEKTKLKIVATDETAVKYITYKWNDEEEVKVEPESEVDTTIEITIDIKRGKNTITITAVNESENTETINKIFNGVNDPIIDVVRDETKLYMKITHDMGFEKVEFNLNGTQYIYDKNYSGYDVSQKELNYDFTLKEGENAVTITAISTEGTQKTYEGICTK